jgi:hypothetical protein
MRRALYEFERGKGLRIDWSAEYIAYWGPRSSLFNIRHVPGPRRRGQKPSLLVLVDPNRRLPPDRKDHAILRLRSRIGHSYKGWHRNPGIKKPVKVKR